MEQSLFWKQVEELFDQALPLNSSERSTFLRGIEDKTVRREVESLLSADEKGSDQPIERAIGSAALAVSREGRRYGPYTTVSLLGAGGMSEVYLARDERLCRLVALKLLPSQFKEGDMQLRRFQREAQMASALNHPNILTVYDIGESEGEFYIATEYIEGVSLHSYGEGRQVLAKDILRIAEQIASALAAAHGAGIVHRDIKPTNIMVRPDGLVKILDFGLARADAGIGSGEPSRTALTIPGTLMGTPRYMAPEQARGLQTDARSDLWSVGAVLYELLAGEPAMPGNETLDILIAVLQREPRSFVELGVNVPAGLQATVFKLLAKDPAQRHASAAELLENVQTLQAEKEELAAVHTSMIQSPARASTRHAWVWLSSAVVVLLLVSIFAVRHFSHPSSQPAREALTYSITAQSLRNGVLETPDEIAPGVMLENSSRFRLNVAAPAAGFFYLLAQDAGANGELAYTLLFPSPSIDDGSARVNPGQRLETGWYRFGPKPGTDKLWLVWSAAPMPQLEALRIYLNRRDKGSVTDPQQRAALAALLEGSALRATSAPENSDPKTRTLSARGAIAISPLEIPHS